MWRDLATLSAPATTSYVVSSPSRREKSSESEANQRAEFALRESVQLTPIRLSLQRGHRLRIRVVDDETGAAIRGAGLPEPPVFLFPLRSVADSKGVYTYSQLTPGEFTVRVSPPEQSQWVGGGITLTVPNAANQSDESSETDVEVRLRRGCVVSGKVIDAATGQGIADVLVNGARTDPKGRFRIVTPPGPVMLPIQGRVMGYETGERKPDAVSTVSKQVEASAETPVSNVVFELQPDALFHGRTLDLEGNPIGGVKITGQANERYFDGGLSYKSIEQESDTDGWYVLARRVMKPHLPSMLSRCDFGVTTRKIPREALPVSGATQAGPTCTPSTGEASSGTGASRPAGSPLPSNRFGSGRAGQA